MSGPTPRFYNAGVDVALILLLVLAPVLVPAAVGALVGRSRRGVLLGGGIGLLGATFLAASVAFGLVLWVFGELVLLAACGVVALVCAAVTSWLVWRRRPRGE